MVNSLRHHTSANDLRAAELQMVDVRTKPGPGLSEYNTKNFCPYCIQSMEENRDFGFQKMFACGNWELESR